MINKNSGSSKHLNFVKISFSILIMALFLSLPFVVTKIKDPTTNQDVRNQAYYNPASLIQSWLISPDGGEILWGEKEIKFFAKNSSDPNAKFNFKIDLYKADSLVKNLFLIDKNENLSNEDGIYTKIYNFSEFAEGDNYKIKLTTTDANGENIVEDYSGGFFTISSNDTKPEFTSSPSNTNIKVGESFNYSITLSDPNASVSAVTLPDWLKLESNTLSGAPNSVGIYSVVLVAVNSSGRQNNQIFSINVTDGNQDPIVTTIPTQNPEPTTEVTTEPTSISTATPTTIPTEVKNIEIDPNLITINLPPDNKLTPENSEITTKLDEKITTKLKDITIQLSKDGDSWTEIYVGSELSTKLNLNTLDADKYQLRIIYKFENDKTVIKNGGEIEIVKQENSINKNTLQISSTKPLEDSKIEEFKPTISGSFSVPKGAELDLTTFSLEIDGNDVSQNQQTRLNDFGFSYIPNTELSYGKHDLRVKISTKDKKSTEKAWSFEVIDKNAVTTIDQNISRRNKIFLGIAIGVVVLILLLSIWAIMLSRKEKRMMKQDDSIF